MIKNDNIKGFPLIVGYLGAVILLIGIITLFPLTTLFFYPEELSQAKYFIVPGSLSILVGYLLMFTINRRGKGKLEKHQDAILVVLTWIIAIFISSIPFLLTGKYNFTQSIFETTSGYSTTGLSVVDVEQTPHIFLFYRSLMQFFGGIGLVLVMTSVLSDRYGMRIYNAEGHTDRLLPNLVKSARLILSIYLGYILLGITLYVIFGMPVFDAINHSISAVSTGGFSTKSSSIGFYNSIQIEVVTIILMLLGSTNFFIHLILLKGKIKKIFKHSETKLLIFLTIIILPLIVLILLNANSYGLLKAFRVSVFQYFTAITTTGYQTVDSFHHFPSIFIGIMILLMLIGGSVGSTAGGMKQYRVWLILKDVYWNIRDRLAHRKAIRTNYANKAGIDVVVTDEDIRNNYSFVILYLVIFIIGASIISSFGFSIEESMFEFSSALSTVGLSIGIIGYNAHPVILWTTIIGMFLGRLEIYIVFLTFIRLVLKLTKKELI